MTDKPFTPSTTQVRQLYMMKRLDMHNHAISNYGGEFDRWLAQVEAAAEQRGAVKALRDAAESNDLIDHMYETLPINQPIAVREASKYLHNRADQMEGDDETH